jgi:hypothetical protein
MPQVLEWLPGVHKTVSSIPITIPKSGFYSHEKMALIGFCVFVSLLSLSLPLLTRSHYITQSGFELVGSSNSLNLLRSWNYKCTTTTLCLTLLCLLNIIVWPALLSSYQVIMIIVVSLQSLFIILYWLSLIDRLSLGGQVSYNSFFS